jgi:hypothetical protein
MFHADHAAILHQDKHYLQTNQTELPHEPIHRTTNKCFQNSFLDYGALGANHAHILHRN